MLEAARKDKAYQGHIVNVASMAGLLNSPNMGAYNVSKAGSSTAKATTLGAEYTAGAVTYKGGIGQVDVDGTKAVQVVGLGPYYALSNRTTVYANVARKKFTTYSTNLVGGGISHSF